MPDSALTQLAELNGAGGTGNGGPSSRDGHGGSSPFDGGATPQQTYVTGMMIALGAIAMFFVALVSASIVRKGLSSDWQPFELPRILWLNTVILVASSVTLAHSRRRFLALQFAEFRHWWRVTTILGIFFLVGQVIAWWRLASSGIFLSTSPNSGFFYVFTVAHGLHLLAGTVGLLVVVRLSPGPMPRKTATEVVALYWHCMTALWLGVFLFLVATK
ncbi:MAG TPA: cytochrome c oxidase subunit 3 [Candidatus Acidoferrales bacterium]